MAFERNTSLCSIFVEPDLIKFGRQAIYEAASRWRA
jgi:hypothetical protein